MGFYFLSKPCKQKDGTNRTSEDSDNYHYLNYVKCRVEIICGVIHRGFSISVVTSSL